MGKFDGYLICTDLDGTLYRNDKTVSAENREAIEYFKREGGYFTFVTGRMPYYSWTAYDAAKPNVPFGAINGGCIYDGEKKEYIWKIALPSESLELVRYIDEQFPTAGIKMCCFDKVYFAKDDDSTERFRQITGVPKINCDYHGFSEPIGKIAFSTLDEGLMNEMIQALSEHPMYGDFDFVRSERSLYEVSPKGIHKGVALVKLADHLGVDISRTISIGDYNNDIGMLRAAGVGVAVANATAEAKSAANKVTVSNEEHAVARVIYDLESGKM